MQVSTFVKLIRKLLQEVWTRKFGPESSEAFLNEDLFPLVIAVTATQGEVECALMVLLNEEYNFKDVQSQPLTTAANIADRFAENFAISTKKIQDMVDARLVRSSFKTHIFDDLFEAFSTKRRSETFEMRGLASEAVNLQQLRRASVLQKDLGSVVHAILDGGNTIVSPLSSSNFFFRCT